MYAVIIKKLLLYCLEGYECLENYDCKQLLPLISYEIGNK